MVDIIIPVYNGQKFLRQSIESALIQKDCNIIIVNDGSTDNTRLIMNDYKDEIVQIHHDKNYGTAKALNTGIQNSKSNWIKWLSADDVLKPNMIKQMLKEISIIPLHNNSIFYTHYDIIDRQGNKVRTFTEPNNHKNSKAVLLDHFYGNGSTSLIHKDVFKKCGLFNELLGYQEDYEFWLRAVLIHGIRLELLNLNTLYYRIHPGQLTEKMKGRALVQSDKIRKMILTQVPQYKNLLGTIKHPIKTRIKRKIVKTFYT